MESLRLLVHSQVARAQGPGNIRLGEAYRLELDGVGVQAVEGATWLRWQKICSCALAISGPRLNAPCPSRLGPSATRR